MLEAALQEAELELLELRLVQQGQRQEEREAKLLAAECDRLKQNYERDLIRSEKRSIDKAKEAEWQLKLIEAYEEEQRELEMEREKKEEEEELNRQIEGMSPEEAEAVLEEINELKFLQNKYESTKLSLETRTQRITMQLDAQDKLTARLSIEHQDFAKTCEAAYEELEGSQKADFYTEFVAPVEQLQMKEAARKQRDLEALQLQHLQSTRTETRKSLTAFDAEHLTTLSMEKQNEVLDDLNELHQLKQKVSKLCLRDGA
eukprot:TRINITY_DN10139_c0_g1_i1.p1 TRINITY_DN10139_c0_g1~~TRINITY_DN10139_c0_g1_i1.p1  ORF type:complete len:269 (+),score=87.53 TRINITY_DN10139_c0_g1_i1:28-807(+)